MRTLTQDEILLAESKISSMSKRLLTTDEKQVFNKYRELYKCMKDRYKQDFEYRFKVDLVLLAATGLIIAIGFFCVFVYVLYQLS